MTPQAHPKRIGNMEFIAATDKPLTGTRRGAGWVNATTTVDVWVWWAERRRALEPKRRYFIPAGAGIYLRPARGRYAKRRHLAVLVQGGVFGKVLVRDAPEWPGYR